MLHRFELAIVPRVAVLMLVALLFPGPAPQAQGRERTLRHSETMIQNAIQQQWADFLEIPRVVLTEHFAIYYLQGHFPGESDVPDYVVDIMAELEFAHQRLRDMGFREPRAGRTQYLSVIVLPPESLPEDALAYVDTLRVPLMYEALGRGSYMGVPIGLPQDWLRFVIAHEVFHFFQNIEEIEDLGRVLWLIEGTAAWAEDEIHPPIGNNNGYVRWVERFWDSWGRGFTPLNGWGPPVRRTDENNNAWYGAAILYKWLTENNRSGVALARELIETVPFADNSKKAWSDVIAGYVPDGDVPLALLNAGLAAWVLDGPAPYRFARSGALPVVTGGMAGDGLIALGQGDYVQLFDAETATITPESHGIESLASRAFHISADKLENEMESGNLFVSFSADDLDSLLVGAIEESDRFVAETGAVYRIGRLRPYGGQAGGSFVVPNFGFSDFGETSDVYLLAVNGDWRNLAGGRENFRWSMSAGEPPVLETVEIKSAGEAVYRAGWSRDELPDRIMSRDQYTSIQRRLDEELNRIGDLAIITQGLNEVEVALGFSRPVRVETARLGGAHLEGGAPLSEPASEWRFTADRIAFGAEHWMAGAAVLEIDARDRNGARLDGDPTTPVALSVDGDRWVSFEDEQGRGRRGGVDSSHQLNLGGEVAYLRGVRFANERGVHYLAEWEAGDDGAPRRLVKMAPVPVDPLADTTFTVELYFSRPVSVEEAVLSGVPFETRSVGGGLDHIAFVESAEIEEALQSGELHLRVTASDLAGNPIDADPATVAAAPEDQDRAAWETGADANHVIEVLDVREVEPFAPYALFTFDDAVTMAEGLTAFSYVGDTEIVEGHGSVTHFAGWGNRPGRFPQFHHEPEDFLSYTFTDNSIYLGVDYGFMVGPLDTPLRDAVDFQTASLLLTWSPWGTVPQAYGTVLPRATLSLSFNRYPVLPETMLRSIAVGKEAGMLEAAELAPGFDGAFQSELDQSVDPTTESLEVVAVKGNWLVLIRGRRSLDPAWGTGLAELIGGFLERVAPRLDGGRMDAGFPDMVEQDPQTLLDEIADLKGRKQRLATLTDPEEIRAMRESIEFQKRFLGVEVGRYQRFKERIPAEAVRYFPLVDTVLGAAQAEGIVALAEPEPEPEAPVAGLPPPLPPEAAGPQLPPPPFGVPAPGQPGFPLNPFEDLELAAFAAYAQMYDRFAATWHLLPPLVRAQGVAEFFARGEEEQSGAPLWLRHLMRIEARRMGLGDGRN